jgi:hypothetical protein
MRHLFVVFGLALLALPATAALDGTGLHAKYAGASLALQQTPTSFGNNYSELDQLWACSAGDKTQIGISGNMEGNGNNVILLFDTVAGGSSVLAAPGTNIANRNGKLTFDADFAPDYGIVLNHWQGTLYANWADFVTSSTAYIGNAPVNGGPGGFDPAIQFALNNTNTLGVNGLGDADPGNADTADTGLELAIDLAKIGVAPGGSYKMLAYLAGTDGNYLSNQFLPSIPSGPNNGQWAYDPVVLPQFTNVPKHYVTVGGCIPEPGSMALLGAAALPLLALRRRRT